MQFTSKKTLSLAGAVAALIYFAQNYSISGLQHLKIERNGVPSQPTDSAGWTVAERAELLMRPSAQAGHSVGFPSSSRAAQISPAPNPVFPSLMPPAVTTPITTSLTPAAPTAQAVSAKSLPLDPKPIRVATFNLHLFGQHKAENPFVIETVAKILRQYDIIAIQEVCTKQQDLLPLLIERINQSDRRFDYVIGPRVGRTDNKEQFAFIFDTLTIETDRTQLYTVDDPEDLLAREPLVGWFRCKSMPLNSAFTFSLVNVHLDAELSDQEIRVLPELVRSIQIDGRQEDDILLIGDFGASDRRLQFLRSAGMNFALEGVPTTSHGHAMLDNIVMPVKATDEFNGRSGVFDFLRQYNLSIDQAHQVSDHIPVWAEFTAYEGGQPGRVE